MILFYKVFIFLLFNLLEVRDLNASAQVAYSLNPEHIIDSTLTTACVM